MGCFDTVHFRCPHCDEGIEDQSKSGGCHLNDYDAASVPIAVAGGIIGDQVCCRGCGRVWIVSLPGASGRVKLELQEPERDDEEPSENSRNITLDDS